MKGKNRRIQQGRRTRENILGAAAKCFAEKGHEGCSMDYLAVSAGLAKVGLQAHFHSREELFTAMTRREFSVAPLCRYDRKRKNARDPAAGFQAFLRSFSNLRGANPQAKGFAPATANRTEL